MVLICIETIAYWMNERMNDSRCGRQRNDIRPYRSFFWSGFFMLFYLQLETCLLTLSRFIWIFVNYKVNLEWFFLLKLDAKRRQCRRKKVIREYDERTWWKIERKKDRKLKMKEQKMRVKCELSSVHSPYYLKTHTLWVNRLNK